MDTIRVLLEELYQEYELDVFQNPGLRSNQEPFLLMPSGQIPDLTQYLDISKIGDEVTWFIDLPDTIESHSLQGSSKGLIKASRSHTLRHNFVSEALFRGDTDTKLGEGFPPLRDDDDILSPDFIYKDPNEIVHVFEVGTSRTASEERLKREFAIKHFKYNLALLNRSTDIAVTYTPIIVGAEAICTNLRLSQEIVDDLILRFNIAVVLENLAIGKGFKITKTDEETTIDQYATSIKSEVEKVENKILNLFKNQLLITNEHIDNIMSPTNKEKVYADYARSRVDAKERMLRGDNAKERVEKYKSGFPTGTQCKRSMKPVCLFPLINCATTDSCVMPNGHTVTAEGAQKSIKKIWNYALRESQTSKNWRQENSAELLREVLETNKEKLKAMQEKRKPLRKEYHKVDLKPVIDAKTLKDLQMDGLFAKSALRDPKKVNNEMLAKRKEQKKGFHYDTEIYDIERFVKETNLDLFSAHGFEVKRETSSVMELLEKANELSQNSSVGVEFFNSWSQTKLYNALDLISDIGMELSGCIKKNTSGYQFILNKLRYHNCYILMKPTNSESHLFYSLFFPDLKKNGQVLSELPFQQIEWSGNHGIIPFKSVRIDKLENISSMSSSLLSLASFWSYFYGLADGTPTSFMSHLEAQIMLKYTLLLRLEDKSQTEEVVTITRYMYMQIFKSNYSVVGPQPFRILSKLPTVVRSRLSLWTIHGIIRNFMRMLNNIPFRKVDLCKDLLNEQEDSLPGDEWHNLLNFISGGSIPNATMVVNLFYIGYAKNKNEITQGNSEWKLLEKVLEEEFSLDLENLDKSYGVGVSPEEIPGKKQFEIEAIKFGCDRMADKLHSRLGPDWKIIIEDSIYKELSKCLSHEIATLKASSKIDHVKEQKVMRERTEPPISRIKVIEAISANIRKFGLNPMTEVSTILEAMEDTKAGVICDLFKKNQHGGLREIYVLTIESRILQLFIEVCSRTICSFFDEETLTHPGNKMKLLDQHKQRSAKIGKSRSCTFVDFCNSSDKTRWNQNFVMPALSIPLFKLLPRSMHNIVQRILNLWSAKLIKIPPEVCNILKSKIPLSSEVYSKLLHQFNWGTPKNKERVVMPQKFYRLAQVTTGMMQGILHYTSSLLHLSFLHAGSYLSIKMLKTMHPEYRFYMTQVCSSDDSAGIISTFTEKGQNEITRKDIQVITDVEISCHTLDTFCKYFCMINSDKSTTGMFDYIEFNSEFLFKNTLAQPIIKLVLASLNLSESDCYLNRFQTMYNIVSDCYSSGFPSRNTHYLQIAQLLLHYKTMGSTVNALFPRWVELILELPDPIYGFFCLDSEFICGLMGYNFSRYNLVKSSEMVRANMMAIDWAESTVNEDGSVSESLVIKNGDLIRWKKLMYRITNRKVDIPKMKRVVKEGDMLKADSEEFRFEPLEDVLRNKYDLLFRHPETREELRLKLLIKASSPGVSKSLTRGNPFVQSLSLSLYSLSTQCFTKTSITKEMISGATARIKETKKTSLILELHTRINCLRDLLSEENEIINGEDNEARVDYLERKESQERAALKLCYPMSDRYEEALGILKEYKISHLVHVGRIRHRKNLIIIQPKVYELPLTLTQVLTHLWFGFNLKVTRRIFNKCLQSYTEAIPWIRDSFDSTLRESPFETHVELYNFISCQSFKTRKVMKCGPGIYSNVFHGQLNQLIKKCYMNGQLLIKGEYGGDLSDVNRVTVARDTAPEVVLSLSLQIPIQEEKADRVREVLQCAKYSSRMTLQNVRMLPRRQAVFYFLSQLNSGTMDMQEVLYSIKNVGLGTLISFTKEQERVGEGPNAKWTGLGECLVFSEGLLLKVTLDGPYARRVYCKDWKTLRSNPGILREVFSKLNVRSYPKPVFETKCTARFDGVRFVPMICGGTPIIVDEDLTSTYLSPPDCKFKIKGNRCGIYCKVQRREVPIIEYHSVAKDIDYDMNKKSSGLIWESWVSCQPMSSEEAINVVLFAKDLKNRRSNWRLGRSQASSRSADGKDDLSESDAESFLRWMKSSLEGRLRYRSLLSPWEEFSHSIMNSTIMEEEEDSSDDFDDFMTAMADDAMLMYEGKSEGIDFMSFAESTILTNLKSIHNETVVKLAFESYTEFDDEDMLGPNDMIDFSSEESPYRAIFHNWLDDETPEKLSVISKTDTFNYLFMHPLWDNMIDEIIELDNKFFRKISFGEKPTSDPVTAEAIMIILDIKERKSELPLSERYRGKITDDWIKSIMEKRKGSSTSDSSSNGSPKKVHFLSDAITEEIGSDEGDPDTDSDDNRANSPDMTRHTEDPYW